MPALRICQLLLAQVGFVERGWLHDFARAPRNVVHVGDGVDVEEHKGRGTGEEVEHAREEVVELAGVEEAGDQEEEDEGVHDEGAGADDGGVDGARDCSDDDHDHEEGVATA